MVKKVKQNGATVVLEEGEFIVENILDKIGVEGQGPVKYLVKWKDWPHSSNTWEPISNLGKCAQMIAEFDAKAATIAEARSISSSTSPPRPQQQAKAGRSDESDLHVLEASPKGRVAHCVDAVIPVGGSLAFLVKWKPLAQSATTRPEDYDRTLIKMDYFKQNYPQLVIAFYERHIIWSADHAAMMKPEDVRASDLTLNSKASVAAKTNKRAASADLIAEASAKAKKN